MPCSLRPGETSVAIDAKEFAKILEGIALGRSRVVRPEPTPAMTEQASAPA